jgi:nitroimidazol reductase NimA-like FMN-containing flavoprotein (pyridoxamine 5'-phosphate oxidase superfamily)
MPDGYGVPQGVAGTLPWSFAEERLVAARNYWISTTRPDGRPHAVPVWGVWVDGKLYFDGSPETRRGRNIAENPAVVAHLESGDQVVIVEGEAHETRAPERGLAKRLAAAYKAKYAASGYSPSPDSWDQGGLYVVEPRKAFAWTKFPQDTTRWTF